MGPPFGPQFSHPLLVAEVAGGARADGFSPRQPLSPVLGLVHHEAQRNHAPAGASAQSPPGEEPGALYEKGNTCLRRSHLWKLSMRLLSSPRRRNSSSGYKKRMARSPGPTADRP